MSAHEPTFQRLPVVCKCGHKWKIKLIANVAVKVWVAHVKSQYCPACGANYHKIAFVTQPSNEVEKGEVK